MRASPNKEENAVLSCVDGDGNCFRQPIIFASAFFFHFHFIIKLLAAYSTVAVRSRLFFHPFFLSLVNQHGAFLCHRFSALALVYFRHPRKLRLMHDPKCQVQLREYSVAGIACLLGAYSP